MARIKGLDRKHAGLFTRVAAHHIRLLRAMGEMEMGQAAATATPVEVVDELFDKLHSHFNEKQLVELTSAIAWENYRARFNHAFGIKAEDFSKGAFCPMPERSTGRTGKC